MFLFCFLFMERKFFALLRNLFFLVSFFLIFNFFVLNIVYLGKKKSTYLLFFLLWVHVTQDEKGLIIRLKISWHWLRLNDIEIYGLFMYTLLQGKKKVKKNKKKKIIFLSDDRQTRPFMRWGGGIHFQHHYWSISKNIAQWLK